ncbi:hypothetical protein JRG49_21430 [Pseudomonas fulva]|uniref:hypothetical protein n=1 Tax=Pseudomonas TaxID=286 RepID=UPI0019D150D5|nr:MULTISPECIES: hypothetical protein [Pseudomonas]MBN6792658.1 hypothetical protein [Pseudomonas fulva]MBN6796088.1 hypothetical protein [Pseudomonas fulva]MBN6858248.1 hypothetical protein [Pseudomonas fulva]MBN6874908.1 hypothetical protein [Pseudomonas fulva]MBN6879733.1 hypothetical protein [Pseudomonas fulva]
MASKRIEPPEGLLANLKDGQSWNYQHGYVQSKINKAQKEALLADFFTSGKESLTFLKEQSKAGVAVPPYATFRLWVVVKEVNASGDSTKTNPPIAIPNTPNAIKAEIARLQGAYKKSLQSKIERLKCDIEKMTQDLQEAEKELEEIPA